MTDDFRDILDGLPEKPPRSRLEPYRRLIHELRRRGRTYQEIVLILEEKCHVHTAVSTVNDFVRHGARSKQNPSRRNTRTPVAPSVLAPGATTETTWARPAKQEWQATEEVRQRIADLKRRATPTEEVAKLFHYDPDEPLRLLPETEKNESEK